MWLLRTILLDTNGDALNILRKVIFKKFEIYLNLIFQHYVPQLNVVGLNRFKLLCVNK